MAEHNGVLCVPKNTFLGDLYFFPCVLMSSFLGDRYSRRNIMAFGVFLWSIFTLIGSFMYGSPENRVRKTIKDINIIFMILILIIIRKNKRINKVRMKCSFFVSNNIQDVLNNISKQHSTFWSFFRKSVFFLSGSEGLPPPLSLIGPTTK